VTLSRAREKCAEAKAQLYDGVDPREKEKAEAARKAAQTDHTFAKIAAELLEKRRREGLSKATLQKRDWFIRLANQDLGDRPITEIKAVDVLVPLRKQEERGNYETARRLRSSIGQVFRYAIATARAEADPTFALRDALITPQVQHLAALTKREDFANLLQTIWSYEGSSEVTRTALKLMAFLYTRPGELRLALWEEFDFDKRIWIIPQERMKMRRPHTKPLSDPVIAILRKLQSQTGNRVRVFPSLTGQGRSISENTMNQALRRMSFTKEEMTPHGFRSSASSLLNESGLWNPDAIEAELAHADTNRVRRVYHRIEIFHPRRRGGLHH
jgi:integrase